AVWRCRGTAVIRPVSAVQSVFPDRHCPARLASSVMLGRVRILVFQRQFSDVLLLNSARRPEGEADVVPLQQVFPVLSHPVPGLVVYLINKGIEIQVVVIRGAGNL